MPAAGAADLPCTAVQTQFLACRAPDAHADGCLCGRPYLQQDDADWQQHPPIESDAWAIGAWAAQHIRPLASKSAARAAVVWVCLIGASLQAGAVLQWRYVMASCSWASRPPALLLAATAASCLPSAVFSVAAFVLSWALYMNGRQWQLASSDRRLQPAEPGSSRYVSQSVLTSAGSIAAPSWPFPVRVPGAQPCPAWVDASDVSSESARIAYKRRLYAEWGYTATDLRAREELHSAARWTACSAWALDLLYVGLALRYRHAPARLARVWAERRAAAGTARSWHVHAAPAASILYSTAAALGFWPVLDLNVKLEARLQEMYGNRIVGRLDPTHSAYRRVYALPGYWPRPDLTETGGEIERLLEDE